MKELLRSVLAGLAFLVAALAGLELYERRLSWPVSEDWYALEEEGGVVRFRCQRFAPVAFPELPAPGVVRLLALGGSTTFGFPERPAGDEPIGRARHGVFGALQRSLDGAWEGRYEVINLGVNGGNSDDSLRLMRRAVGWGAAGILIYDGHNELMAPPQGFSPALWESALYRRFAVLWRRPLRAPAPVAPPAFTPAQSAAAAAHLRRNLEQIYEITDGLEIPVVVATQSGDQLGMDPSWSTSGDPAQLLEVAALSDEALRRAQAASPGAADLAWQEGRRQEARGEDPSRALQDALDLDGLPYRATSEVNAAIRAARSPGRLALVESHAALGVGGEALFYDNVHPRPEGARRLASALAEGMVQVGLLPEVPPPLPPSLSEAETLDAELRTARYWLLWACVRPHDPAWRLERARSAVAAAELLSPGSAAELLSEIQGIEVSGCPPGQPQSAR